MSSSSRLLAIALVCAGAACKRRSVEGEIPEAHGAIAIDGEWEEPEWSGAALRAQFRGDDGELARPSSEIRLLHDDDALLVALYAADENIETRDAFELSIGPLSLRVDAAGKLDREIRGARVAVGRDEGTLDDPSDDDEEWVVELALPLAAVDLARGHRQLVRASRCDVPKDGTRRCGTWSGEVEVR